ncbi:MAG: 6-phosphogluconolactonase [Bryobacteraceae bacterium]
MRARRIVCASDAAAAESCAQEMLTLIAAARHANGRANIAISGGSSPKPMFAKMAAAGFDWTGVDIFFVDERCVPPTDSESNYKMANEHLLQPARIPPAQVHRILGEIDPHEAARQYAAGLPHAFDVIHRGIGPDAHTASLFPGEPLIDDRANLTAATYAAKFNQWRVTLLPAVLLAAKHTVVLASGADKAEALAHVFGPEHNEKKYPGQIGIQEDIEMTWYVTSE